MIERFRQELARNWGAESGLLGGDEFLSCVVNKRRAEGFCSAVVAVFPYFRGYSEGKISLYARFEDYHCVLTEALERAAAECLPESVKRRAFADVSPLNEVRAAALAGLGCVGRNGLLITPEYGSFVFIGELLLDIELPAGGRAVSSCLDCGKCVSACPTGALRGEGECLSSLTQKKRLTPEEAAVIAKCGSEWGCDVCQIACPMNRDVKKTAIPGFSGMTVEEVLSFETEGLSDGELLEKYSRRAFTWRGAAVLRRNEAIVSDGGSGEADRSPAAGK